MNNIAKKLKNYLLDSNYRFMVNVSRGVYDNVPDREYLEKMFKVRMGYDPNLDNPESFNEKIQWLKLNNRQDIYSKMVDKYLAKEYVAEQIGDKYVIPTLGVWNNFDEIDFDKLPNQFVLKTTHDSGGIVICQDKSKLDVAVARKKINKSMKNNYYLHAREWPYKNVKPRIIAEEYLENDEDGLHDYKVWCFNGEPQYIQYITGRIGKHTYEAFYNKDWVKQDFTYHNPLLKGEVPKPERLQELLECCRTLAEGTCFLRTDFYVLKDGTLRFGEMTFYPMSGFEHWHPKEMETVLGAMIKLPCDEKG